MKYQKYLRHLDKVIPKNGDATGFINYHAHMLYCIHVHALHTWWCSLVPRPHLQGGKGSGELGQNSWACAKEFPRASEIMALAQSHDKLTTGMQHRCIAV